MSHDIRDTGSVPTFYSNQVLEAERFYLDAVGGAGQPLAVVCGGRERCGPEYRIDRADFPFHSIEFVARGTGTLRLRGRTVALYPGRIFTYGPGVAHLITTDAGEPLVKYFVDFTGPAAAKVLCDNDLAPGSAVRVASPDAVLRIFDDLIANGSSGTRHGPAICAKLVELLALKVAEACPDCGEALHHHRADDGPAYLTILVVGKVVMAVYLAVYLALAPEPWVMITVCWGVALGMALWLLPRFKGALVALQWSRRMHGFGDDG